MRILTYKRTHPGDPSPRGRFGVFGCMGRVRSYGFDAVIGVGGIGAEAKSHEIDGKINWVGIGPKRHPDGTVSFEHFRLFEYAGPSFSRMASALARRMYGANVRLILNDYTSSQWAEVEGILRWSQTRDAENYTKQYNSRKPNGCQKKRIPCKRTSKC